MQVSHDLGGWGQYGKEGSREEYVISINNLFLCVVWNMFCHFYQPAFNNIRFIVIFKSKTRTKITQAWLYPETFPHIHNQNCKWWSIYSMNYFASVKLSIFQKHSRLSWKSCLLTVNELKHPFDTHRHFSCATGGNVTWTFL